MKSSFGCIGTWVGMFIALVILPKDIPPILAIAIAVGGWWLGYSIAKYIEEEKENERLRREEYEHKRWQEEIARERKARRISEAQALVRKYPEATKKFFKEHFGLTKTYISEYDITDDKVDKLLYHSEYEYQRIEEQLNQSYRLEVERKRQEQLRRQREEEEAKRRAEIERRRKLASKFTYFTLGGYKAAYYFDYYPKNRYPSVSSSDESNRRALWDFKDGSYSFGLTAIQDFIDGNFSKDEMRNWALCVIPASTQSKNDLRYKNLCAQITNKFPISNGFNYISIAFDRNDSRECKSSNTISNLNISYSVYGKRIILFDDITTRGTSFIQLANQLKANGALEVYGFFLGKTVSF